MLTEFHGWLRAEALEAGGIGPDEGERLWRRHIADSLTFLAGLDGVSSIVDVGSGVGLPGIPLAISLPDTQVTLLDRSERRCWLARRASRVLGLANVEVLQGEARQLRLGHAAAVSRATLPPQAFFDTARVLLPEGEVALTAVSHGATEPATGPWEIIRIPAAVLGGVTWLAKVPLSSAEPG
ncbi:MAG: hypothetical protein GY720_09690 [bacterium]|nr:hypothetical protein [bacterium]